MECVLSVSSVSNGQSMLSVCSTVISMQSVLRIAIISHTLKFFGRCAELILLLY